MTTRPGGLTAICVLTILLAILGLFGSLIGAAVLVIGQERIQTMMPQPQGNEEVVRVQKEMQAAMNKVNEPLKPVSITLLLLEIAACVGLIVGSAMALGLKERGRRLLRTALLLTIPLAMVRGTVQCYVALSMSEVNEKYMPMLMEAQSDGRRTPVALGPEIARLGKFLGLAWIAFWLAVTLLFYIFSWFYLNREHVRIAFVQAEQELA